mgnify:FL=1|tara:strand:- start:3734 stop:4741 length:1008 start_codon:yes stop_codon:yes gene_type:complete
MASSFTSNLTLEKPGAGEQSNAWGNTLNTNFDAIDTAISLKRAGTPQGNIAASFVGQTCVDTSNKVIYIATTAGNAATAVWTPANVADASVTLTGDVTGTANFSGGNVSIPTTYAVNPVSTGVISMFGGSTAPTGYLLCNGAEISRSTYSSLFAIIGTTYGSTGATTFTLPNLQDKFARGKSGSSSLGQTGGSENITPSGSISSFTPSGSVSVSGSVGSHTLTEAQIPNHFHYIVHNNNVTTNSVSNFSTAQKEYAIYRGNNGGMGSSDTHLQTTNSASILADAGRSSTVGSGQSHNHSLSVSGSFSGNSATPSFTGNSVTNLPPYVIVNYIIKT